MICKEVRKLSEKEMLKIQGKMTIVLKDKTGKVKDKREVTNVITEVGKEEMAGLLLLDVTGRTPFDYIAIGTGTIAADPDDTSLAAETHREDAAGSLIDLTTATTPLDTAQLVATFGGTGYSGTEAVTESGVFNSDIGGILLCRQTFPAINVDWTAGDSIEITWRIQFTTS